MLELKSLELEEYQKVKNIINAEYSQNRQNKKDNYVNFTTYSHRYLGIYENNNLIGIIKTVPFMGELSLEIYIFPAYRGYNYAKEATQLLVNQYGYLYSDTAKFYINIDPHNKNSLKVLKKLGWKITYDFEDTILEEGSEYFYTFYQNNPFYKQKTR